ncbi:hypothetical protein [Crenothrix sp.]|uniref:hypothetical protein n=1 Tax=Crenothrix sp. TaxID=3100433 RepID=UPI00374C92FD
MIYLKFKKLALCSLVSLFVGHAYAHTIVRDAVVEGKASYNGFVITHGCNSASEGSPYQEPYPVLGQSAIFPMMDSAVWRKNGKKIIGTDGAKTIDAGTTLKLGVTGLAGLSSAFRVTEEIVDKLGNVHALHWKKGGLEPKLNTVTPFKITAPLIADNCVKSLIVRIGVINWCDVNQNAATDKNGPYLQPKDAFGDAIPRVTGFDNGGIQRNVPGAKFYTKLPLGNGDNNRADWWFPALDGGSKLYNDVDLLQQASVASTTTVASPAFWTTMTISNSAADVAKCKGKLVNVTVEPSGADFDAYLTGANTKPFTRGSLNF